MIGIRPIVKILSLAVLLFGIQMAQATLPPTFNYQGFLTDIDGAPVDDTLSITFSIYDVSSGGTPLWSDIRAVTIEQGVFSVELGPFPMPGMFDYPLWIGLSVESDPEMTPRRPITSTGFAFKAGDSDTLEGMSASTLDQSAHVSDTSNPHDVTASQTGAASSADLTLHEGDSSAHHVKTTTFPELSGQIDDSQIPSAIARDSEVMPIVLGSDGSGSTLNADLLDGLNSDYFMRADRDSWVDTAGDTIYGDLISSSRIGIGRSPGLSLDVLVDDWPEVVARFENVHDIAGQAAFGTRTTADARDTITGAAETGSFYAYGGTTSGQARGIYSIAQANGDSRAYAVYANATGGTTTGGEYAFYGVGDGYLSQDLRVGQDLSVNGAVQMGFERVGGTSVNLESTTACGFSNSGTCYYAFATAACPTGKVATGGGCNCSSAYNCFIGDSYQSGDGSWFCRAVAAGNGYSVTPSVTCARMAN